MLGAELRRLVGARSLRIQAARLDELLEALAERGGEEMERRLFGDGAGRETHCDLRVLVNGRNSRFLEGLAGAHQHQVLYDVLSFQC